MAVYNEPLRPQEFLTYAVWDGHYSFEEVTLTAAQGELQPGTVMAKVTATGNWVPYDDDANAGTPGAGIAAGVLVYGAANNVATQKVLMLVRHAVVKSALLQWEGSNDAGEKTAALADLLALGIVAR